MPESLFRRWCIKPNAEIVARLRKVYPSIPIIGFPRGAGALYQDFVRESGVSALSLDQTVPAEWAAEAIEPGCTLQGNLDPQALVAGGEVLASETRRIISAFGARPHIFNLGHGIPQQTPPEHVGALVDLVHGSAGLVP